MDYEKYLMERLMESRHSFIYAEEKEERQKFLKEMVSNYPVILGSDYQVAVYIDDKGLPSVSDITSEKHDLDTATFNSFHSRYYDFLILYSIMEALSFQIPKDILNNSKLLNRFSIITNAGFPKPLTFDEILEALKLGKESYYLNYLKYVETGSLDSGFLSKMPINFVVNDHVVFLIKRYLDIRSHFCLIFDIQNELSVTSQKSINRYIFSRCNRDIAIKVACSEKDWNTYRDFNGNVIEYIHDYDCFDINNHLKKRTLK